MLLLHSLESFEVYFQYISSLLHVLMTQFTRLMVHHRQLPTLWLITALQYAVYTAFLFPHELQFTSENCVSCITAAQLQRQVVSVRIRDFTIQLPVHFMILFLSLLRKCLLLSQVKRNNLCQSSNVTWEITCEKASLTLFSFKVADTANLNGLFQLDYSADRH